jgi:hypothetical protein
MNAKSDAKVVLSTGQIAAELHTDRDRVSYAIRKARVEPVGRAGMTRLFSQNAVEIVRDFLAAKRESRALLSTSRQGGRA